ncbi:cell polarity protein [Aspergillus nomiae NRRL 13137]|uniref:Cell polarity protein n=1 Tax=Aspergillus nomiae NRRL (strain ATCC 15546 / NRRL 13137 / CBS 260.88 / M93) TaxID=1509407 RepID=A0A0L1J9A5_ASPN3|nr:cell polarity protein [Aspergillus nomiae NRRL 13137]KNG87983.1 cell polarity protein [Aspergillus nomiae NRRL 13137]
MNGHSGTMSPVSVDGSDWSGINQYQKSEGPFSPTLSSRGNLATPPTSGAANGPNGAGLPNGTLSERMSDSGNPPSPTSVAARSSDGTLSDQRSKRYRQMEEILGKHYVVLRRFLSAPYREDRNGRPSKARDKLLRLSATQFHELSTDVYDELLRRQQAMPSPGRPPRPDIPPFLPPRQDFHEKRNQARQKLASLQHVRFRDLATDVYTELERRFPQFPEKESRRASPAPSLRGRPSNGYPPPNGYGPGAYPPPRSQSRGPPRRGYPSGGPPGSPMSGVFPPRQGSLGGPPSINGDHGPMAKSFQSNTIVPNKSTMVEDDDDMAGVDDDYDARSDAFALDAVLQSRRGTTTTLGEGERKLLADTQSQVSVLQEKVNKLEELLKSKDEELSKHHGDQTKVDELEGLLKARDEELSKYQEGHERAQVGESERQEWEDLKLDLESKISKVEDLNSSLQTELDKVRTEHDAMERELRSQVDGASQEGAGDAELQARFADLEVKHKGLQAELQEQQQVTEEVRREAAGFLMEMKALSEQSHSRWEHEERLSSEVHRLEEEVKQWKSRYAKAKTQLRHLRASSTGIELHSDVNAIAKDNAFLQENGLVKDVHVTKFQISIDELLRIARFDDYNLVMQQIKAVVIAVRHVLHDVEVASDREDGLSASRTKATRKVSATANNLITASKNFASSCGLSPVSLLDAAASHLSTAVVDLIRLVKIQPSPAGDLNEDDEEQLAHMKSPDYFSVAPSQGRFSNNGSIYSAMSPPSNHSRNPTESHAANGMTAATKVSYPGPSGDHELQELKLYVEDQTEGLVQSIQALVASIRAEDGLTTIRTHISAISSIVTNVSSSTEHFIHKPEANPALRQRTGPIIEKLDQHRTRLMGTATEGEEATSAEQVRDATNKLPPIAFEIARETKELVQRLDPVDQEESEDDFR